MKELRYSRIAKSQAAGEPLQASMSIGRLGPERHWWTLRSIMMAPTARLVGRRYLSNGRGVSPDFRSQTGFAISCWQRPRVRRKRMIVRTITGKTFAIKKCTRQTFYGCPHRFQIRTCLNRILRPAVLTSTKARRVGDPAIPRRPHGEAGCRSWADDRSARFEEHLVAPSKGMPVNTDLRDMESSPREERREWATGR